jgi:hypothetical protein
VVLYFFVLYLYLNFAIFGQFITCLESVLDARTILPGEIVFRLHCRLLGRIGTEMNRLLAAESAAHRDNNQVMELHQVAVK